MPKQPRPFLFYGWWIVLSGLLIRAVGTGAFVWAFSVFITPLEREFGWSRAELSAAISLSFLVTGVTGPVIGRWVDRRGTRGLLMFGSTLAGTALGLLALTARLWHLYLLYLVSAVGRSCMAYIPVNTLMANWFSRRRGLAMGISTAGMGLGGLFFLPLSNVLLEGLGWRQAFVALGVLLWLVVFPLALLVIRDRPEDLGLLPDNRTAPLVGNGAPAALTPLPEPDPGWTVAEAVRSRAFRFLSLAFLLVFFSQLSLNVHTVPFLIGRGLSSGAAALMVGYASGLSVFGRVLAGYVADRILSGSLVLSLFLALQVLALGVALVFSGETALWIFVVAYGIASGAAPSLEPFLVARIFGRRHFGTLLGLLGTVETVGIVVGPVIGGHLYDVTGDYFWSFLVFAAAFFLGMVAIHLVPQGSFRGTKATASPAMA